MNIYFEYKGTTEKQGTIRAIIINGGKKERISTGIKIDKKDWQKGMPKQIGKNASITLALKKYTSAFEKYMTNVHLANEVPSITRAKTFVLDNVITGNTERGKKDIRALIEVFRKENEAILTEDALKPYKTLSNHLEDYNKNLQFSDIDKAWGNQFAKYLATKSQHVKGATNLQNPSVNKMIIVLKAFCKWAYNHRNKYTSATGWRDLERVKEVEQRIITLTKNEFNQYANHKFGKDERLSKQRDVFCFSVYTGLRFQDMKLLTKKNFKTVGKNIYLHLNTNKTGKELKLELIDQAKEIILKYDYQLPIITNQKTNEYIKKGVELAGIDRKETVIIQHLKQRKEIERPVNKLISIHDARKTFVTLALEGGMSISEVMQMSTHKDYRSFARYVELEAARIRDKHKSVFALTKVA